MRGTIREGTFAHSPLYVVDNSTVFILLFYVGQSMKKKTLLTLPKLKQDIIKSIFQTDNKRYGGIVEKIIKRKQEERKKNEDTKV